MRSQCRKVYGHVVLTPMSGPYVVGIDAGGTKTRCAVLTSDGIVAGSGTAAGANPNSGGDPVRSLTTALRAALGSLDPALVVEGVFGIAGAGAAGRPAAVAAAQQAWENAGISGSPTVVTDIAVAFAAGTAAVEGVVVFAGTGAGAAAISDGQIIKRSDGYGWLVGDEGSAVWLGKEAVRAALAAYDGRGSATLLAESVPRALLGAGVLWDLGLPSAVPWHIAHHGTAVAHHGPAGTDPAGEAGSRAGGDGTGGNGQGGGVATATRPVIHTVQGARQADLAQAIIKEVYGRPASALGRLGPVVGAAATAGDPVAQAIISEAADRLLMNVDAVRPAVTDPEAPVVMAGSVLESGPVADMVRAGLRQRFAAEPRQAGDGAVGAAGMALRKLRS